MTGSLLVTAVKTFLVSDVFCGLGHGISVGGLGKYPKEEGVVGLTVRNCTSTGTKWRKN